MEAENQNQNIVPAAAADQSNLLAPKQLRPKTAPGSTSATTGAKRAKPTAATPLGACKAAKIPGSRPGTAGARTPGANTRPITAVTIVKENLKHERAAKTAALKERWAQEKEERLTEQRKKKEAEQKSTRDELRAIAEKRKLNKEKEKRMLADANMRRHEELKAQNDERAQLARDLKEKKLKKRRESAEMKQKAFREAQVKEKMLEQQKKDEEKSLLESRRIAFLEARNAVKESESNRRQSLVNRAQISAFQREVGKKMEQQKAEEDRDMLQFRREAFQEKKEYEKSVQKSRRQSLIGRLDKWREEKHLDEEAHKQEVGLNHEEAELRLQDWHDLQEYKKALAQRDRESLERRLEKWREERTVEAEAQALQAEQEHMERELFAQECEDVMLYREEEEASRRQSLAYRLVVARRDRDWEDGVEANQAVIQMHERQIQAEEREDVHCYKQELYNNRRASLAFRLQQYRKEAQFEMGKNANEAEVRHEEHEIIMADVEAVKEYKKQQQDEERMEVAARLAAAKRAHEVDLKEHRRKLNIVHDILETRRQDRIDTMEYEKGEKEKRRKSVCLRLDSWRQQKMAKEQAKRREQMRAAEEAFYRQMDHEDLQAAKQAAKEEEISSLQLGNFKI